MADRFRLGLLVLLILALAGCAETGGTVRTETVFTLEVVNNTAGELARVGCTYYLDGTERGGCEVIPADETTFGWGTSVEIPFDDRMLSPEESESAFAVALSLQLPDGRRFVAGERTPLIPGAGDIRCTLTGSAETGFLTDWEPVSEGEADE